MKTVILTAMLALCLWPGLAAAVEPIQCVSRVDIPGGGAGLKNNCTKTINVSFCVDNPRSSWACRRNSTNAGRGTYDASPQKIIPIQGYSSEGGGSINYIACFSPDMPVQWSLERNSFACR